MTDLAAVAAAYWARHRLSSGDRAARLRVGSGEGHWAWEIVNDAVMDGSDMVIPLIDALLTADGADPCLLGAGPIEDLLVEHGPRFSAEVVARCRQSNLWTIALRCVWLDEAARARMPDVVPFLAR